MGFRNFFGKEEGKNAEIIRLDPEQSDAILKNIVEQLDFEETDSKSPGHSCYYIVMRKYILKTICAICLIFFFLFILISGTFKVTVDF